MTAPAPAARAARTLVVCLDGTGNQIGASRPTNPAKVYEMLDLGDPGRQLAYYDPGIGTLPASTARGRAGRFASRVSELALGIGLRENLTQAYAWLMQHYQPGDRVCVFGFSRGAYTARALVGMLTRPGLMRPGSQNLLDYAVREFATNRTVTPTVQAGIREFADAFCWGTAAEPLFPGWHDPKFHEDRHAVPIHYLGVWDTVKATGALGFGNARWPYTRMLFTCRRVRHAVSVDERRRPYHEFLVTPGPGKEEVWFAGVHSDVGGTFDPGALSTVSLKWVLDGVAGDLLLRPGAYAARTAVTPADATAPIHRMGRAWALAGTRTRPIPAGAVLHETVRLRRAAEPSYLPDLAGADDPARWADPDWLTPLAL